MLQHALDHGAAARGVGVVIAHHHRGVPVEVVVVDHHHRRPLGAQLPLDPLHHVVAGQGHAPAAVLVQLGIQKDQRPLGAGGRHELALVVGRQLVDPVQLARELGALVVLVRLGQRAACERLHVARAEGVVLVAQRAAQGAVGVDHVGDRVAHDGAGELVRRVHQVALRQVGVALVLHLLGPVGEALVEQQLHGAGVGHEEARARVELVGRGEDQRRQLLVDLARGRRGDGDHLRLTQLQGQGVDRPAGAAGVHAVLAAHQQRGHEVVSRAAAQAQTVAAALHPPGELGEQRVGGAVDQVGEAQRSIGQRRGDELAPIKRAQARPPRQGSGGQRRRGGAVAHVDLGLGRQGRQRRGALGLAPLHGEPAQLRQPGQTAQVLGVQWVVVQVEPAQLGQLGQRGQVVDLVLRQPQPLELDQLGQRGDVTDRVLAQLQRGELGQAGQRLDGGDVVFPQREVLQVHGVLKPGQVGDGAVWALQIAEPRKIGGEQVLLLGLALVQTQGLAHAALQLLVGEADHGGARIRRLGVGQSAVAAGGDGLVGPAGAE